MAMGFKLEKQQIKKRGKKQVKDFIFH